MIRIDRGPCPPCLKKGKGKGTKYRHKQVVSALWEMQHKKCCYSEVAIPEEGHGKAVEHFRPQAIFKGQRNEWKNLLLVSPQCNGKKKDQFPIMLTSKPDETKVVYTRVARGRAALHDPSDALAQSPERLLTYVLDDEASPLYGQIVPRNGSTVGRVTIDVTGIGESFFLRQRQARALQNLWPAYLNILNARRANDPDLLRVCLDTFQSHMAATAEFAGLAREFARTKKLDIDFGLQIPD
jgi:uncharacterized protein (TIGR02646 family)